MEKRILTAVKALETYLHDKGIVGITSIEGLKDSRVGIDVDHYVSRILHKREFFGPAVGGPPSMLKQFVKSDLKLFKKYNIIPVFVFNGIRINSQFDQFKSFAASNNVAKHRADSWNSYYLNHDKSSSNLTADPLTGVSFRYGTHGKNFNKQLVSETAEYVFDFFQLLNSLSIEWMVAPYSSWCQLNYLYANQYVDVVCGPTECLLASNIDKFIIGIDFANGDIKFVDKQVVLDELKLTYVQLKEISAVLGFDLQPDTTLAREFASFGMNQDIVDFRFLHEAVLNGMSIHGNLLASTNKPGSKHKLDIFKAALAAIDFCPVLREDGKVALPMEPKDGFQSRDVFIPPAAGEQKNSDKEVKDSDAKVPNDVHSFISQKLPHEYILYHSVGILGSKLLETIVYGLYIEDRPLDGGNSSQYKALINSDSNIELKNKMLNLFTSSINRYYQNKKIRYSAYFQPTVQQTFDFKLEKPIYFKLAHYLVRAELDDPKTFNLSVLIGHLKSENFLKKIDNDKSLITEQSQMLHTPYELLSTAFVRLLYLYDFVSLEENKLTSWGEAFVEVSKENSISTIFVLLVLLKNSPSFKLDLSFSPPIRGEPRSPSGTEYRSPILIITRLSMLFKCPEKLINSEFNTNLLNKLNHNLLTFRSGFNYVKNQIDEFNQTLVVSTLTNNQFDRKGIDNNKEWRQIGDQMALHSGLPNTIMGIIADVYFDYLFNVAAKDSLKAVKFVSEMYKEISSDLKELLKSNFKFVEVCLKTALKVVAEEEKQTYQAALEFLKKFTDF